MTKRLENISFEHDGVGYELGFGLDEVQKLANLSKARQGRVTHAEFIKIALSKYSDRVYISDDKAEEIRQLFLGGIETEDDKLTYDELIGYLYTLSIQAIDDAAKEVEPAIVKINEDSTVNLTIGNEKYKLMFTREQVVEALEQDVFDNVGMLDLFATGSTLIQMALEHYNKRFSAKRHEEIFLSLWATKFNEETEDDLIEVIHALNFHMKEVVSSGIKKSKAAFKVTKKK